MISHRKGLALTVIALLALEACTNAPLIREPPKKDRIFDNKLRVNGEICTSDPADLVFPLKVMFIIDTSQSMNVNDPVDPTIVDATKATNRARAMRDVIVRFIDLGLRFAQTKDPTTGQWINTAPSYCNTGLANCGQGSTTCPACNPSGATTKAMCVGPDCCPIGAQCFGKPACPLPTETNATCLPMCDVTLAGCKPGEKNCPDCPTKGDRCVSGICAKNLDPGVEFAIVRFGAAKDTLTRDKNGQPGFTSDARELVSALPRVNFGSSVTDYEGALSNAYTVLSKDMANMQKNNTTAVARSKYVVILLTDGQPDPRINDQDDWAAITDDPPGSGLRSALLGPNLDPNAITEYNVPTRILRRVNEIMGLKSIYRIGDIRFHTAYIAGQNPAWAQDQATTLLKQMATVGKGTFRNFQNGEAVNFLRVDFSSLRRVFRLKNLLVTNVNGRPSGGETITDSDGDALDDRRENLAGTSVALLDTDKDGFSDTLEYFFRTSGWDPLDPTDADCSLAANDSNKDGKLDDTDGDGLFDCEERFLGTSRFLFDTDADGIPDAIEVRFGTNPVAKDIADDLDFDGMPNGDEIRLHTDPRADDAAVRSRASYRYSTKRIGSGVEMVGIACADDKDCPQGKDCVDSYCRCIADDGCSTLAACKADNDCTRPGERCDAKICKGSYTCQDVKTLGGTQLCAQKKNVTCYSYAVANISLVTPKAGPADKERGWNNVYLYFGEVPFDNPDDHGNFKVACVRARFLAQNGLKLPANGQVEVPKTAWKDPTQFVAATDCVCPAGNVGTCP